MHHLEAQTIEPLAWGTDEYGQGTSGDPPIRMVLDYVVQTRSLWRILLCDPTPYPRTTTRAATRRLPTFSPLAG